MPQSRLFGVEDRPGLPYALALAVQHALLALVFLVYPLAAAQQIGLSASDTERFLTAVVLSIGVATCLHGFRKPVGSGALAVEIPTPAFLPAAVLAGSAGGLSMLAGISLVSGLVELLFAGALQRLRRLFPAEVCGVAVLLLGMSLARPGILNVLVPLDGLPVLRSTPVAVASVTLATITALSVFARGRLKLLALATGVIAGIGLWGLLEPDSAGHWSAIHDTAWIGLPDVTFGKASFAPQLLPLCVVMAILLCVDNVGMLIGIQRQQDAGWQRIDIAQARSGIRVSAIGDLAGGLLGGMPTGISSANISLAHATGTIARRISLFTGLLLLAAAFSPKAVQLVSLIPRPVVGAVMIYAAAYMLVSGMALFLGRLLDERRMFVVGFSIVIGLGPLLTPGLFDTAPEFLRPVLDSPLALGSFSAILLTQFLRLGTARRLVIPLSLPDSRNEMIQELYANTAIREGLTTLGEAVCASRATVQRAIDVTAEWIACLTTNGCIEGSMEVAASFHDDHLDITLAYEGRALPAQDPTHPLTRLREHVDSLSTQIHGRRQCLSLGFESA